MDFFLTLYLCPDLKLENCVSNLFLGICKTKKQTCNPFCSRYRSLLHI